jgi:hypothetical protein
MTFPAQAASTARALQGSLRALVVVLVDVAMLRAGRV